MPPPPACRGPSLHHLGVHHPLTRHWPQAVLVNGPRVQTQSVTRKSELASLLLKESRRCHLPPCSSTGAVRDPESAASSEAFYLDHRRRNWDIKRVDRVQNTLKLLSKFTTSATPLITVSSSKVTHTPRQKTSHKDTNATVQQPSPRSRQRTAPSETAGYTVGRQEPTEAPRQEAKQQGVERR